MGSSGFRPILFAVFLTVFGSSGALAADAEVTDIRVGKHGLSTRIVVDLDRKDELDDYWWRQSVHLKLEGSLLYCLLPLWEPEGIDYLNHNCKPNARVEDQLYVYADRDIEAGEEITADYRTFNLVPQGIRCWCPEPLCVI